MSAGVRNGGWVGFGLSFGFSLGHLQDCLETIVLAPEIYGVRFRAKARARARAGDLSFLVFAIACAGKSGGSAVPLQLGVDLYKKLDSTLPAMYSICEVTYICYMYRCI